MPRKLSTEALSTGDGDYTHFVNNVGTRLKTISDIFRRIAFVVGWWSSTPNTRQHGNAVDLVGILIKFLMGIIFLELEQKDCSFLFLKGGTKGTLISIIGVILVL